jgi:CheY-like chemotaxis protein
MLYPEVKSYKGGLPHLRLLTTQYFGAVLLDASLPDSGGVNSLRRLRQLEPAIHKIQTNGAFKTGEIQATVPNLTQAPMRSRTS